MALLGVPDTSKVAVVENREDFAVDFDRFDPSKAIGAKDVFTRVVGVRRVSAPSSTFPETLTGGGTVPTSAFARSAKSVTITGVSGYGDGLQIRVGSADAGADADRNGVCALGVQECLPSGTSPGVRLLPEPPPSLTPSLVRVVGSPSDRK